MSVQDKRKKITGIDQLVDYLASGCKEKEYRRIGTEHEKFAFNLKTLKLQLRLKNRFLFIYKKKSYI